MKDIDRYTKAIKANPKDVVAYNDRGVAYSENRQGDKAIADFTKAIEIDPKYVVAYNNRGVVYRMRFDFDRAIADYIKAIEIDPDFEDAYHNLGSLNFLKNIINKGDEVLIVELDKTMKPSNKGKD